MANVQVNATISARDAASKNIKTVNKALGALGKTAGSIGSDFKALAVGIGGALAGVGALTISAIKEAAAGQAETAKLNAALKARGLATESVAAAIERQIVAGQKLAFSDGEVRASVEASTRFTKKYSDAVKIQNAAFDLSRATGMSLEEATIALGKAYQGNGAKLFGMLGIQKKGLTGIKAINAILGKTKGSATAYADTLAGSFEVLTVGVDKLKGDFGDAFLPALTKLFKGLAPYIQKFSNTIKANTPQLEKWADVIVNKILENLPRLFREFQRLIPKGLKAIEGFANSVAGIGKEADGLLGPGGSITLLVTGIGAAFGGLKGAITANLVKGGMDPFTALIVGNIASQIPIALANALISTVVTKAVTAFGASLAAATTTATAASAAGAAAAGGGAAIAAASITTIVGTALLAAIPIVAGAFAIDSSIKQAQMADALVKLAQKLDLKNRTTPLVNAPTGTDSQSEIVRTLFFSGYKPPVTATEGTTTNNIYIGTGKVDTVVSDSITRLVRTGRYQ
jgi:hypothetical protein